MQGDPIDKDRQEYEDEMLEHGFPDEERPTLGDVFQCQYCGAVIAISIEDKLGGKTKCPMCHK